MPNPLFNVLGNNSHINDNNFAQMLNDLQQFRQSFRGNPRDEVQRLLNSGQMSQKQFNVLSQMTNQIVEMLNN